MNGETFLIENGYAFSDPLPMKAVATLMERYASTEGVQRPPLITTPHDFKAVVKQIVMAFRGKDAVITDDDLNAIYPAVTSISNTYTPAYVMQGLTGKRVSEL